MRRSGRHHHRRARRRRRKDQPDVHPVSSRRAGTVPRAEAGVRSGDAAQPRKGCSHPCALRRIRPHACTPRQARASRAAALLSLEALQERIRDAAARGAPLRLRGGGSKDFYGNEPRGELLDTRAYAGIAAYEPSELVLTARCGTPLSHIEGVLNEKGQCLPFEPPHFGAATFGGCVAAGLSGPRRASAGALRDFVLGVKLIDGRGRLLQFGGQVMENDAGYDISRLVAGSLRTLRPIAPASLKALPGAPGELPPRLEMAEPQELDAMKRGAAVP